MLWVQLDPALAGHAVGNSLIADVDREVVGFATHEVAINLRSIDRVHASGHVAFRDVESHGDFDFDVPVCAGVDTSAHPIPPFPAHVLSGTLRGRPLVTPKVLAFVRKSGGQSWVDALELWESDEVDCSERSRRSKGVEHWRVELDEPGGTSLPWFGGIRLGTTQPFGLRNMIWMQEDGVDGSTFTGDAWVRWDTISIGEAKDALAGALIFESEFAHVGGTFEAFVCPIDTVLRR